MNYKTKLTQGLALMAKIGIIVGVVSASLAGQTAAGDDRQNFKSTDGSHQSVIRIRDTGGAPVKKNVYIGLGKSALIEFPREVRDVLLSNPAAVDAVVLSANRVFLLARSIGESNAFFFDADGNQFATLELFVERETAGLTSVLNRLIPGSDIRVEMLNQSVVLTGTVRNPSDSVRAAKIARQFIQVEYETTTANKNEGTTITETKKGDGEGVINMLVVEAGEQVMLRVTVAEVQRSVMKQFGINIGAVINSGNFSTQVLTSNAFPLTGVDLGTIAGSSVLGGVLSSGIGSPGTNSGVSGTWGTGTQTISQAMRALERHGLVRTLAEPNMTAVSGETAKFLAGGEFPIPIIDSTGQISVEYKEFGIGLAFTPVVMSEGRISLKLETEVSELSSQGAVTLAALQIPALRTRKALSTVELPSGGAMVLAGLLSEDTRQNIDGMPGLKDLPVLGTLFRSREYVRAETELLVIVSPYIVRPTSPKNLTTPTAGLASATDTKTNFFGHLNRVYGRRGASIPEGGLKGDYGFIVE
ncbi:MAG: type II and III secretion system protein family protein [Hyphomicrobiaceae bacterium]